MSGSQFVIITGRIGQDPEIKYTPSKLAICSFSIATSKKKKSGEEVTSWHRCKAFDKAAETISKYVTKGRELQIFGELSYGQYEKDGITRYTTDIIVNQFTFIGGSGQQSQSQNNTPAAPVNQQYSNQGPPGDGIPF